MTELDSIILCISSTPTTVFMIIPLISSQSRMVANKLRTHSWSEGTYASSELITTVTALQSDRQCLISYLGFNKSKQDTLCQTLSNGLNWTCIPKFGVALPDVLCTHSTLVRCL